MSQPLVLEATRTVVLSDCRGLMNRLMLAGKGDDITVGTTHESRCFVRNDQEQVTPLIRRREGRSEAAAFRQRASSTEPRVAPIRAVRRWAGVKLRRPAWWGGGPWTVQNPCLRVDTTVRLDRSFGPATGLRR